MKLLLMVCAGGALGAGARHLMNVGFLRWLGPGLPWATPAVNVLGCLLMGLLVAALAGRDLGATEWRAFLATGVLGGFTTFSAFSLDFAMLLKDGEHAVAALYLSASVALSILALFAGLAIGRSLFA